MARNTYIPPASQATYAAGLALEGIIKDARAYHTIEQRHRSWAGASWVTRWQHRQTAHAAIRALRAVKVAANADRMAALREAIEDENISYGELAELQGMAGSIPSDDLLLRQWAGLPEQPALMDLRS